MRGSQIHHGAGDQRGEGQADRPCAQVETSPLVRDTHRVRERGAERSGHAVGEQEREDRIQAEPPVRPPPAWQSPRKQHPRRKATEMERDGSQVAGGHRGGSSRSEGPGPSGGSWLALLLFAPQAKPANPVVDPQARRLHGVRNCGRCSWLCRVVAVPTNCGSTVGGTTLSGAVKGQVEVCPTSHPPRQQPAPYVRPAALWLDADSIISADAAAPKRCPPAQLARNAHRGHGR